MELFRILLDGRPHRVANQNGSTGTGPGVVGIDVAPRELDGVEHTVAQLLLDDDHPLFDRALLDGPIVAELIARDGAVLAREPFDHDRFRRQLQAERDAGESITRGVLVLTGGELPPPYVRLAFLPVAIASTAGAELIVRQSSVAELIAGVEQAYADGEITDDERRAVLISIEQRHPETH
jgi:hypothetical protein